MKRQRSSFDGNEGNAKKAKISKNESNPPATLVKKTEETKEPLGTTTAVESKEAFDAVDLVKVLESVESIRTLETPTTPETPQPFFLFFDVETDGNGLFRPFSQKVVQVSWTATDKQNRVIESYTSFVKGATVLKYNPNKWTLEQINSGEDPSEVCTKFTTIANKITQNMGFLVAHNISFDMDAVKSMGVPVHQFLKRFCTKENTTSICKLPGGRSYKWPTQQQLHQFLEHPAREQTHDASDDVNMLRENFFECVKRANGNDNLYSKFLF